VSPKTCTHVLLLPTNERARTVPVSFGESGPDLTADKSDRCHVRFYNQQSLVKASSPSAWRRRTTHLPRLLYRYLVGLVSIPGWVQTMSPAQRFFSWAYAGSGDQPRSDVANVIISSRAGKTSIQQVLFKNLPPKETFYLETTMRIIQHRIELVFSIVSLLSC
jgi:hypothetical protein